MNICTIKENKVFHKVVALLLIISFVFMPLSISPAAQAGEVPAVDNSTSVTSSWFMSSPPEWPFMFRPGLRGGNSRTLFYTDYFIPVMGTNETLFFLNPKLGWDDESANEQNIGCGIRSLFFDDQLILGGNIYYDRRKTEYDNRFNQLGFGIEALSKWVDLRSNFYLSLSDKKAVDQNINYSFASRSLLRRTPYEEPLNGLDYEAGLLIPYISDYAETRLCMGGYHYFTDSTKDINGIKGRLEIRPTPMITIDIEVSDDNMSSAAGYIGGYVTLPFSIGDFLKGKNAFGGWKDIIAFGKGTRPLRERMTDVVIRDMDVILQDATEETKEHDLTYVDNSNASGTEDGSLEHPYTTLQDGNDHAIGDNWVYVKQGNADYVENVVLADNITLWGAGYNGGFKGIPSSGYPVIDGNDDGNTIILANNNTVMGCTIQNSDGPPSFPGPLTKAGIFGQNINGAKIHHNNIIDNNGHGVYIRVDDGNAHSNFTVSGNTITGNLATIYIDSRNSSDVSGFTISGNTITGNSAGIEQLNCGGTDSNFTISGNTITGNGNNGISLRSDDVSDFTISGNTITGNGIHGIFLDAYATSDFTISGNTIMGNGRYGIYLNNWYYPCSNFTISGNTITGNDEGGIFMFNYGATVSDFTVSGNTLTGNGESGIYVYNYNSTVSGFTVSGNTIAGNMENGIYLHTYGDYDFSNVNISRNTITDNIQNGVNLINGGGAGAFTVDMGGGAISAVGRNSIFDNNVGAGGDFDVQNDSGVDDLPAQYNWWGTATPQASQFGGDDSVDYTNPLSSNPN